MNSYLSYKRFLVFCLIFFAVPLFGYIFYQSQTLFLSAVIGIGFSALVSPVLDWMGQKNNYPRKINALIFIVFLLLILLIFFIVMGSVVAQQVRSLYEIMPEVIEKWESQWNQFIHNYPKVAKSLENSEPTTDIAKTTFASIGFLVKGAVETSTGFTLGAVIALFTTLNLDYYYSSFVRLFPSDRRKQAKRGLDVANKALLEWFNAQLIDMVVVSVLTSVGLWIAGIDYWIVFGLMTGVLAIIPYAGVMFTFFVASLIVLVQQPDKLIWLCIVFVVCQQIEGNIIIPKIMKDKVKVPSALLVFLMILMTSWFGILGVFITPPALAILLSLKRQWGAITR